MNTGHSAKERGLTNGFLNQMQQKVSHQVMASQSSFDSPAGRNVGNGTISDQTSILNNLDESLWDSFNRYSNVSPYADAFQYLKNNASSTVGVTRYR